MNWFWTLTVSLISPFALQDAASSKWRGQDLWLVFASTSFLGLLFFILFMKETKGLTEAEVKKIYINEEAPYVRAPLKSGRDDDSKDDEITGFASME